MFCASTFTGRVLVALYFGMVVALSLCDLSWFHAPKTASTFCLSLQHACAEKQFADQVAGMQETLLRGGCVVIKPNGTMIGSSGHAPITNTMGNYVGIFRDPVKR
jgi:hypothetical protein